MSGKKQETQSGRKRPGMIRRGVQPGTIDKVAAKVMAAETAETQEYEVRQVPLGSIRLWEQQPRTFHLTLNEVYRGIVDAEDEYAEAKADELEGITGLAMSLKEFGMLNAPLAYALPGKAVQLLGGQRRTMAAIFGLFHIKTVLGSDDVARHEVEIHPEPELSRLETERIAVKVFSRKPDDINIERIGITDNVQRTELPIPDKLRWVLKFADMKESRGRKVDWRNLVDTLGLSRSQSYQWLKVIQSRSDEWVQRVIHLVISGEVPLNKLTEISAVEAADRQALFESWFKARPKSDKNHRVSLGVSSNLPALRSLVLANVNAADKDRFEKIDWRKPKEVKKAFADFLKYWEEKYD